jgi:hypothetical protein
VWPDCSPPACFVVVWQRSPWKHIQNQIPQHGFLPAGGPAAIPGRGHCTAQGGLLSHKGGGGSGHPGIWGYPMLLSLLLAPVWLALQLACALCFHIPPLDIPQSKLRLKAPLEGSNQRLGLRVCSHTACYSAIPRPCRHCSRGARASSHARPTHKYHPRPRHALPYWPPSYPKGGMACYGRLFCRMHLHPISPPRLPTCLARVTHHRCACARLPRCCSSWCKTPRPTTGRRARSLTMLRPWPTSFQQRWRAASRPRASFLEHPRPPSPPRRPRRRRRQSGAGMGAGPAGHGALPRRDPPHRPRC